MKRKLSAVAMMFALTLLGTSAMADPDLNRLQQLAMKFTQRIGSLVAAQSADQSVVPPMLTWTPQLDIASKCVLAEYRTRMGADQLSSLFGDADRVLSRKDLTIETAKREGARLMPLPQEQMSQIDHTCGFSIAGLKALARDPNFPNFVRHAMRMQSQ